jgi:threonine synthase
VVALSTAHGLKFIDFKMRFHQGRLPESDRVLSNLPVDVAPTVSAVLAAIEDRVTA